MQNSAERAVEHFPSCKMELNLPAEDPVRAALRHTQNFRAEAADELARQA